MKFTPIIAALAALVVRRGARTDILNPGIRWGSGAAANVAPYGTRTKPPGWAGGTLARMRPSSRRRQGPRHRRASATRPAYACRTPCRG